MSNVVTSALPPRVNAALLHAVADRLTQPDGRWQRFEAPAALRAMCPQVDAADPMPRRQP